MSIRYRIATVIIFAVLHAIAKVLWMALTGYGWAQLGAAAMPAEAVAATATSEPTEPPTDVPPTVTPTEAEKMVKRIWASARWMADSSAVTSVAV